MKKAAIDSKYSPVTLTQLRLVLSATDHELTTLLHAHETNRHDLLLKLLHGTANNTVLDSLSTLSARSAGDRTSGRLGAYLDDYILRQIAVHAPSLMNDILDSEEFAYSLPLVDAVLERFTPSTLAPCVLLASQHLLRSIVPQFAALRALGIRYEDMFVLGKVYSSSRLVVEKLKQLGVNVHAQSVSFPTAAVSDPDGYETMMAHAALDVLEQARKRRTALGQGARLLILDDGGLLIETANKLLSRSAAQNVFAVEQTTGGIRRLARQTLKFPVISVAGSYAKQVWESPFIADSIVSEIDLTLSEIHGTGLKRKAVAVLGYGSVGTWVTTKLKRATHRRIAVYDPSSHKTGMAAAHTYIDVTASLSHAIADKQLVVGCSGVPSISSGQSNLQLFDHLRSGVLLASGSSTDIEFQGLRSMGEAVRPKWLPELELDSDFLRVHSTYMISRGRRRYYLANGGFPINFTGEDDPIPIDRIQLTRALMLAGACQSFKTGPSGHPVEFNKDTGGWLIEEFETVPKSPEWPLYSADFSLPQASKLSRKVTRPK